MVKRAFAIASCRTKVFLANALIVGIAIPVFSVVIPYWIWKGESDWAEFRMVFKRSTWRDTFGDITNCHIGSKYFIVGAKNIDHDKFLPYVWYDGEDKMVCCLFLDDAVAMNLMFGGTLLDGKGLSQRYKEARERKKNNARR